MPPEQTKGLLCAGKGCMCQCVSACGVFGGVGLVTHYKCQKDLSPQPVHLLLGAAGATDGRGELVSAHQKTCLLDLSHSRWIDTLFWFIHIN